MNVINRSSSAKKMSRLQRKNLPVCHPFNSFATVMSGSTSDKIVCELWANVFFFCMIECLCHRVSLVVFPTSEADTHAIKHYIVTW